MNAGNDNPAAASRLRGFRSRTFRPGASRPDGVESCTCRSDVSQPDAVQPRVSRSRTFWASVAAAGLVVLGGAGYCAATAEAGATAVAGQVASGPEMSGGIAGGPEAAGTAIQTGHETSGRAGQRVPTAAAGHWVKPRDDSGEGPNP